MSKAFLDAEVHRLAPEVHKLQGAIQDTPPKNIVLTGATGYLGSFILAELLLKHADAIIWCITRMGGLPRILDALARTQVEVPPDHSGRVRALHGDLGLPQLGLSEIDAAHISSADLIIHNGALVHWTRPYRALLAPNVHSLLALFALAPPSAKLVFVSGGGQTALDECNEQAFATTNGYSATKFVAERLCGHAGPGVQVLRPGYIIGEPVCNADDFLWRLARVVIELGVYVRSHDGVASMNAAPVRYVARRVIQPRGALDRIWVQCPINELWDALVAEGYQLRQVDDGEWEKLLEADLVKRGASHPLIALAPFAKGMSGGLGYPRPNDLLEEQIESGVLQGCIKYLQDMGDIPLPDGNWKHVEDRKIGRTGR
jgi:thioester reductase-like protein